MIETTTQQSVESHANEGGVHPSEPMHIFTLSYRFLDKYFARNASRNRGVRGE